MDINYSSIFVVCLGLTFFIGILCTFLSMVLETDQQFIVQKPKSQPYHPYYDQSHKMDVIIIDDDLVSPT